MNDVDLQRLRCQQMSDQQWEAMIDRIPDLRAVATGEIEGPFAEDMKQGCLQFVLAEALVRRADRTREQEK